TEFLRLNDLPASAALGYLKAEGNLVNTLHLPVQGSADGGAFTTTGDMHRFWRALVAGEIVRPETYAMLTEVREADAEDGFGAGLGIYVHPSRRVLALSGYDAGQSFYSWHVPETDTTITVLGNTSDESWPVMQSILDQLHAAFE